MSRFLLSLLLMLALLAAPHRATAGALPVVDTVAIATAKTNFIKQTADTLRMINNGIQQIRILTDTLNQGAQMLIMMGDPRRLIDSLVMTGLFEGLEVVGLKEDFTALLQIAGTTANIMNNARGLYTSLNRFPQLGQAIQNRIQSFRHLNLVDAMAESFFRNAATSTQSRMTAIRQEIQTTARDLNRATTQTDIAKQSAKLQAAVGQAQVAFAQHQAQALGVLVQHTQNQNRAQIEAEALALVQQEAEQQDARAMVRGLSGVASTSFSNAFKP